MDPFAESLETRAGMAGAEPSRAFTRVEIGPRDLPEPAGGYVDLVLDGLDDPDPSSPPACAARTLPTSPRGDFPRTSLLSPGRGPFPTPEESVPRGKRPRSGSPESRGRWLLVPEVLVVVAFVLAGGAVAGAAYLARAPRTGPAAGARSSELAPPSHSDRRGVAQARAGSALPGDPEEPASEEPEEESPTMEAPVEPEPPPAPTVAPWGGGG